MDRERWDQFTLMEKMGNVSSEVSRLVRWLQNGDRAAEGAGSRVLELIDATIAGELSEGGKRERSVLREVIVDLGGSAPRHSIGSEGLQNYLREFAVAARAKI